MSHEPPDPFQDGKYDDMAKQAQQGPSREISDADVELMIQKIPGVAQGLPMSQDGVMLRSMLDHYLVLRRDARIRKETAPVQAVRQENPRFQQRTIDPRAAQPFPASMGSVVGGLHDAQTPRSEVYTSRQAVTQALQREGMYCPVIQTMLAMITRGAPFEVAAGRTLIYLSLERRQRIDEETVAAMLRIPDPREASGPGPRDTATQSMREWAAKEDQLRQQARMTLDPNRDDHS
jgi:hypothetical protein